MARHPRPVTALALTLSLGALTACSSSDPQPFAAPTPSTSAAMTSLPTQTATPVPSATQSKAHSTAIPTNSPLMLPDATRARATAIVTNPAAPASVDEMRALLAVQQYSLELVSGLASGSSATLRSLSASTCGQCKDDANLLDQRVKSGRHFQNLDGSTGWRQLIVGTRGRLNGNYVANAAIVEAPSRYLEGNGKLIHLNPKPTVYNSTYVVHVPERGNVKIVSITEAPS